jgi:hypothetical protein
VRKDYLLCLAAALGGAAVWAAISLVSGRSEAWDSGLYFAVGLPVVCLMSLVFGYFWPSRSWRWGVAPFVGQFLWMLVSQGPGNLLPLGMAVFAVFCLPAVFLARVGASIATRRARSP